MSKMLFVLIILLIIIALVLYFGFKKLNKPKSIISYPPTSTSTYSSNVSSWSNITAVEGAECLLYTFPDPGLIIQASGEELFYLPNPTLNSNVLSNMTGVTLTSDISCYNSYNQIYAIEVQQTCTGHCTAGNMDDCDAITVNECIGINGNIYQMNETQTFYYNLPIVPPSSANQPVIDTNGNIKGASTTGSCSTLPACPGTLSLIGVNFNPDSVGNTNTYCLSVSNNNSIELNVCNPTDNTQLFNIIMAEPNSTVPNNKGQIAQISIPNNNGNNMCLLPDLNNSDIITSLYYNTYINSTACSAQTGSFFNNYLVSSACTNSNYNITYNPTFLGFEFSDQSTVGVAGVDPYAYFLSPYSVQQYYSYYSSNLENIYNSSISLSAADTNYGISDLIDYGNPNYNTNQITGCYFDYQNAYSNGPYPITVFQNNSGIQNPVYYPLIVTGCTNADSQGVLGTSGLDGFDWLLLPSMPYCKIPLSQGGCNTSCSVGNQESNCISLPYSNTCVNETCSMQNNISVTVGNIDTDVTFTKDGKTTIAASYDLYTMFCSESRTCTGTMPLYTPPQMVYTGNIDMYALERVMNYGGYSGLDSISSIVQFLIDNNAYSIYWGGFDLANGGSSNNNVVLTNFAYDSNQCWTTGFNTQYFPIISFNSTINMPLCTFPGQTQCMQLINNTYEFIT